MVPKSWRLNRRARLYECRDAAFTHVEGVCSSCGETRRKAFSELGWKEMMTTIDGLAQRTLRCPCGGRIKPSTV